MTEASNAKIMDAFAQSRDEALAALDTAQVKSRMDLQAMKAERDAAQHLESAVAGMLRETEVALASVTAERDKWKQMAEWQYALRRYPHDLEMGNGALDAHMKSWTWDAAIDATRKGKT